MGKSWSPDTPVRLVGLRCCPAGGASQGLAGLAVLHLDLKSHFKTPRSMDPGKGILDHVDRNILESFWPCRRAFTGELTLPG